MLFPISPVGGDMLSVNVKFFNSCLWITLAVGLLCYWQAVLALSIPDSWKQFKTSFRGGGTQRLLGRLLKHVSRTSCIIFPQSKWSQGKSWSPERHGKSSPLYFYLLMCKDPFGADVGIFLTLYMTKSDYKIAWQLFVLLSAVVQSSWPV